MPPLGPPNMTSVVLSYSIPGTRRRFGAFATNADGMRVRGAEVDTPGLGHLFPASGDILTRFGLQDVSGLFEVHTLLELRAAEPLAQVPSDWWIALVGARLVTFEVAAAGPWLEGPAGDNTWTVAVLQEVRPS